MRAETAVQTLTDRAVFEILLDRADELHLRDVGSGETITVTNVHASDATRPGMYLIGRPVPVGDTYRDFSGFFPVTPHLGRRPRVPHDPTCGTSGGPDRVSVMACQ